MPEYPSRAGCHPLATYCVEKAFRAIIGEERDDSNGNGPSEKRSSRVNANGFPFSEEAVFLLPREIKMMQFEIEPLVLKSFEAKWGDEIERAIANARRTAEDKRSGREWYGAGGRTMGWVGR